MPCHVVLSRVPGMGQPLVRARCLELVDPLSLELPPCHKRSCRQQRERGKHYGCSQPGQCHQIDGRAKICHMNEAPAPRVASSRVKRLHFGDVQRRSSADSGLQVPTCARLAPYARPWLHSFLMRAMRAKRLARNRAGGLVTARQLRFQVFGWMVEGHSLF